MKNVKDIQEKTVLLIVDDVNFFATIKKILMKMGLKVISGLKVIKTLLPEVDKIITEMASVREKKSPLPEINLILVDYKKDISGDIMELLRIVKGNKKSRNIPFVIMVEDAERSGPIKMIQKNKVAADGFITKPVDLKDFTSGIEIMLNRK